MFWCYGMQAADTNQPHITEGLGFGLIFGTTFNPAPVPWGQSDPRPTLTHVFV
jgi:hypothetical protein